MDPLRIFLRAAFTFVTLLVLLRVSGKQTLKHGSGLDFTVALILGDLVDDAVWGEVPLLQFAVASATLLATHVTLDRMRARA